MDLEHIGNIPVSTSAIASLFTNIEAGNQKVRSLEAAHKIIRLKKGLYVVAPNVSRVALSTELIANHLYAPSYVSMQTALRYYGLIPEAVYTTQSMTLKHSRSFDTPVGRFEYKNMSREAFSIGITSINMQSYAFLMATPEKALCDLIANSPKVNLRYLKDVENYLNEEAVGNAWKKSGVNRDEIFLVSKVWPSNYGDGQTMKSIDESLRKLQTDYIDLMLLHQPYCDRYGAYRDLEKAYKVGKVRAIGVSNFFPDHLIDLASNMEVAPMVNQMETHVFNQQHETRKFMDEFDTKLMAWAPLAEGQNGMFTNPTLTQIGEKYGKTAAQVALRWLLQSDVIIIPKTVHKERMQENLNLFDFELDAEDMQKIAALDTAHSLFLDHHSGETTKQFMEWRAVVKPTE